MSPMVEEGMESCLGRGARDLRGGRGQRVAVDVALALGVS